MKDFIVYTDSTTDLSPQLIDELGVKIIPLEFNIDDRTFLDYPDRRELGIKEFYDMVRDGKQATTSLINQWRYVEIFEPELKSGKDILYIAFSSGLSGSVGFAFETAEILTKKYPDRKLIVVDSLAASMGEGLLVYLAVEQKRSGLSIEQTAKWVEDNRNTIAHWFTVDDLKHLRRGGRLSATAAFLGSMLNIKPVLHVDNDGKLIPISKVRGRNLALQTLIQKLEEAGVDLKNQVIFISHGDCEQECREMAREIEEKYGVKKVFINEIGPVIGAHAGPRTIALFFVAKEK